MKYYRLKIMNNKAGYTAQKKVFVTTESDEKARELINAFYAQKGYEVIHCAPLETAPDTVYQEFLENSGAF